MEELLNTFGQTIKDARQAIWLTQEGLAERVHFQQGDRRQDIVGSFK